MGSMRAYRTMIETSMGSMIVCVDDTALLLLEFVGRKGLDKQMGKIERDYTLVQAPQDHPVIAQIARELDAYFAGDLQDFQTPIHMRGTDFQIQCWEALRAIPYGQTLSYAQQARVIGKPKAVRAVAHANSLNPLGLIVPCHRVIGSNGQLTGYAGGLDRKAALLDLEKAA